MFRLSKGPARSAHESEQIKGIGNRRQLGHVAREKCVEISLEPIGLLIRVQTVHRDGRIVTVLRFVDPCRAWHVVRLDQFAPLRVWCVEERLPHAGCAESQVFVAGQWPELHIGRASGERLVHRFHRQQIGRSGQHESSGLPITIDGALDGNQEIRRALHFVDRHAIRPGDEAFRIAEGLAACVKIVEGKPQHSRSCGCIGDEGALARLPRTHDHGHGLRRHDGV